MKVYVVFLLVLVVALSCDEVANVFLPDKTAEGMNTLGFATDDHIWMNYGVRCTDAGCRENMVSAVLYKQGGARPFELTIKGGFTVHRKGIDQLFTLVAHGINGVGAYHLNINDHDRMCYAAYDSTGCHEFVNSGDAELIVTAYDTSRHIIAGEFRARLSNLARPGQEINIREGRFDAELIYHPVK